MIGMPRGKSMHGKGVCCCIEGVMRCIRLGEALYSRV